MQVYCLEEQAFYSLIEEVVERLKSKHDVPQWKWVSPEEAMRLLNVQKTKLQTLRDTGKIRISQPDRKTILYDRDSIEAYLEKHAKETF